ncbi:MAG: hypothetical protein JXO22_00670 [Phycisphaerae bacterium]|nr:hypothetical protein [Phycisphaerae bacterium]
MRSKSRQSVGIVAVGAVLTVLLTAEAPAFAGGWPIGDINGDGMADVFDIDAFVGTLTGTDRGHVEPSGYYPLDGNARDYGTNQRAGTEHNGAAYETGLYYEAATFAGSGDWIQVRQHAALSMPMFSWTAWFRMETPPSTAGMMVAAQANSGFGTGSRMVGPVDDGGAVKMRFQWAPDDTGGNTITGTTDLLTGRWHHVAVTYDGMTARLYIDGELEGSLQTTLPPVEADLGIGGHLEATDWDCLVGAVDEFRMYDRALSPYEVADLATTIDAFGFDEFGYGLGSVPLGAFSAISHGQCHCLALRCDGKIVAWGDDTGDGRDYGQVTDTPTYPGFVAISAGRWHSLALYDPDGDGMGSLVAWGWDDYGQVSDTPADDDYVAVSAGYWHNVAMRADGSVVAWGVDEGGWRDQGQVTDTPTGNDFVKVSAGRDFNIALKSDGSLVAWGNNDQGQCAVPTESDFKEIGAGYMHSVAIRVDGTLEVWGRCEEGQCIGVPVDDDFIAVSAGWYHSMALRSDGTVVCWGSNGGTVYGETTSGPSSHYGGIAAGYGHSLTLVKPIGQ